MNAKVKRNQLRPTIDKQDYYQEYKNQINKRIIETDKLIDELNNTIDDYHKDITDNKEYIATILNIDLNKYIEYKYKTFDYGKALYGIAHNRYKLDKNSSIQDDGKYSNTAKTIMDYCTAIHNLHKNKVLKDKLLKADAIGKREFNTRICRYYNKVVERLILRDAYKFSYGIGDFCIEHISIDRDKVEPILNFAATRKRKKELEDAGIEVFNQAKYDWHKARNIPYKGVDYRIYIEDSNVIAFRFKRKGFSYLFSSNCSFNDKRYTEGYDKYVEGLNTVEELAAADGLSFGNKVALLKSKFPHELIKYNYEYSQ